MPRIRPARRRSFNVEEGGARREAWLARARPLYAERMGTENMAPLLGALVRFVKPRVVLEVGAGYTSAFLLQALADNVAELASLRRLLRSRAAADWPHLNWLVEPAVVGEPLVVELVEEGDVARVEHRQVAPLLRRHEHRPKVELARLGRERAVGVHAQQGGIR